MSRYIINTHEAKFNSLQLEEIELRINSHFTLRNAEMILEGKTPRIAPQEKLKLEMITFIEEIILPQLETGFRLDLSDKLVNETLNIPARRVKQIRLELKAAGIIWFPKWSKPKKLGDYPYWMVQKEFINFVEFAEKVSNPRTSKYNNHYCMLLDQAKKECYDDLVEYENYVTVQQYMVMVYTNLNMKLAKLGLTKTDLLK